MNRNLATSSWSGDGIAERLLLSFARRAPQFRGKGRIFQWLARIVRRGALVVRDEAGVRLRIHAADYIGRTICDVGSFEPKSIQLAKRLMAQGGVFLDIGCNFGLYALPVGSVPGVRCIAIDGSFTALARCSDNLGLNPSARVELVSCALTERDQLLAFHVPIDRNLGTTRIDRRDATELGGRFWVAATTLGRVLDRLAPGSIKLLKIDVEGAELSVFEGLNFNGPFRPENLIVECYVEEFPQAVDCFHFLLKQGYAAYTVDGKPVTDCQHLPEENVWFRCQRAPMPVGLP